MKKVFLLLGFGMFISTATFSQLNMTFVGSYPYDVELSNIWGYTDPNGTEYALVGTYDGVSIISLADPANPVEVTLCLAHWPIGENSNLGPLCLWHQRNKGRLVIIGLETYPIHYYHYWHQTLRPLHPWTITLVLVTLHYTPWTA